MTMQFDFDDLVIAAQCGEEIAEERVEQLEAENATLRAFVERFAAAKSSKQWAEVQLDWLLSECSTEE